MGGKEGGIMGRPRKTEAQRRAERFDELYRLGKAKKKYTDEQIGQFVGVTRQTINKRRKDPGKLDIALLAALGKTLGWSDEDYLAIICPERR